MRKPNILFLLADDQNYSTIGALGNKEIKTPNLDKLVKNGFAFENAHIPGGTCPAVCMPSRAMIHSSRTLFHIQGCGEEIPREHMTIGEMLKDNGYTTCGIGKWHNGTDSYRRSFTNGANIFFGGMWDHWNVPICDYDSNGDYDQWIHYTHEFWTGNDVSKVRGERIEAGVHSTELMTNAAIDFMRQYDEEKPFFMYVSYLAPHDPRTMPEQFKNMYNPDNIEVPMNFATEHIFDYGIRDMRDEVLALYPRTKKEIQRHIAEYYAMISHLDDAIGRIMHVLKEIGELENTIIIYAADNGLSVGSHGLLGKQNLYEKSIRVPLIFSGYGIPKDKKSDEYAYLLDIFPTICDMIGVDTPKSVEGKSLVPVIENQKSVRDDLYLAYSDKIRGIKDRRYKLIAYRTDGLKETQLFDLIEDPLEMRNLIEEREYSAVVDELSRKLEDYAEKWDDTKHFLGDGFWKKY